MSETSHTQGPWVAIHEPGHSSKDMIDNGGYRIDAPGVGVTQLAFVWVLNQRLPADGGPQVDGPHFGDVRAGANARLIAAAPDMLAVLQEVVKDNMLVEGSDWWGRVNAAIAKAEGRS